MKEIFKYQLCFEADRNKGNIPRVQRIGKEKQSRVSLIATIKIFDLEYHNRNNFCFIFGKSSQV